MRPAQAGSTCLGSGEGSGGEGSGEGGGEAGSGEGSGEAYGSFPRPRLEANNTLAAAAAPLDASLSEEQARNARAPRSSRDPAEI